MRWMEVLEKLLRVAKPQLSAISSSVKSRRRSIQQAISMRYPNRVAAHHLAVTVSGQNIDLKLAPYSATVVTMKRK